MRRWLHSGVSSLMAFAAVFAILMALWVSNVDRFKPEAGDECRLYSQVGCVRWVSGRPPFDVRNGSRQGEATLLSLAVAVSAGWVVHKLAISSQESVSRA